MSSKKRPRRSAVAGWGVPGGGVDGVRAGVEGLDGGADAVLVVGPGPMSS
jgi:hypothetical protein